MMARKKSIAATLAGEQTGDAVEAPAPPAPRAAEVPVRSARTRRPATRPTPDPAPAVQDDQEAAQAPKAAPPKVLISSTKDAKRVGLYLHEDDFKALGIAKLDDGADANDRIRAMIAVWRANPRFRTQVDRLARTAPKGRPGAPGGATP